MGEYQPEKLQELIDHYRFDEAALQINERHRVLSDRSLAVFEDLFCALVEPTFRGDLQNLRGILKIGGSSPRSNLRRFISNPRVQNCLSAVLKSLEKSVPSSVHMGFRGARDFFRASDFSATYKTDILNYELEYSRLTDQRLVRLLSSSPNTIDLKLLAEEPLKKKEEVLASYEKESLDPIKDFFKDALVKCDDFFANLEEHSSALGDFNQNFRERNFVSDEKFINTWLSLGDEYFQLELMKSSLMLPVSPKALYWGMQKEYPVTLALLEELKEMVTPMIEVGEPVESNGTWSLGVECRNPLSLKTEGFTIEPSFRLGTTEGYPEVSFSCSILTIEPNRRYRCIIGIPSSAPPPPRAKLRITCDSIYYNTPFITEKSFDL